MNEENKPKAAPRQMHVRVVKAKENPVQPVSKAEHATNIAPEKDRVAGDWLQHPLDFDGLDVLVQHSTILPQCIKVYQNNVVGFGIEVDYVDDIDQKEETSEMKAEYDRIKHILDLLSFECSTQNMLGRMVATRERYGIAYLEVIRNLANEVVEIVNIRKPGSIFQTTEQDEYVDVPYYYKGEITNRKRRFRKFKQVVGAEVLYFKEFGDPRIMDRRNGCYVTELELENQANELLDFPIGDQPYGEVRWIGQIMGVDGAHRAEKLNNNYFQNGRHTPLMIMIQGGTMSEESYTKLQGYMEEIKGEAGQHAFLVVEFENTDTAAAFEETKNPTVQVKDLSPMLQKDELFQGYLDNVRKKCQSAFQLPDLYVGYCTDFNRATAQTAMEITEKQVFIPYRNELSWLINRRLFAEYQFKYCEVRFRAPDVTNPDDQAKILNVAERAGGVTPNDARQIAAKMTGATAENYEGDWGNVPLVYTKALQEKANQSLSENVLNQLDEHIQKAAVHDSEELVAVMKQVRRLLVDMGKQKGDADVR